MRFTRKNGATSNVFRVTLRNATTGQGLTGLTNASTGLVISTIADVEASATAYTAAGSTIDTIATLGMFAAPTATHCRFKEVDSTNHPGLYELQIADARFAVSNAKQLNVTISGATNLLTKEIVIQLTATDVDDSVRGGMSAIPNATAGASGGLPTLNASLNVNADAKAINAVPTTSVTTINANLGTTQALTFDGNNYLNVNAKDWAGGAIPAPNVTGVPLIDLKYTLGTISPAAAGSVSVDWAAIVNKTATVNLSGTTIATVTNTVNISTATIQIAMTNQGYTSARAGYLDNINLGGAAASHADILAINQSASKHLLLVTVGQYEPGETYTVEMRTFAAADGSAVNADTTPTLTATGTVSGNLSANLSAAANPATGVYRWTYTPGATPGLEQIRFDGSATISSATFTLSAYAQTVDMPTAVFTSTDQSHLTAIFNKLPTNNIGDETLLLAAIGAPQQAGSAVTLPSIPNNWITAAGIAAGALNSKGDWLLASSYTAPPTVAQIATAVWTDTTAGDFTTQGSPGYILVHQLAGAFTSATSSVFSTAALVNAPGGGNVTVGGYASGQDPATLVLGANAASWNTAGTIGHDINASGSASDPWGGVITATQAGTLVRAAAAVLVGKLTESADHTTSTWLDAIDGTTTRVTSTQTTTTRTPTIH